MTYGIVVLLILLSSFFIESSKINSQIRAVEDHPVAYQLTNLPQSEVLEKLQSNTQYSRVISLLLFGPNLLSPVSISQSGNRVYLGIYDSLLDVPELLSELGVFSDLEVLGGDGLVVSDNLVTTNGTLDLELTDMLSGNISEVEYNVGHKFSASERFTDLLRDLSNQDDFEMGFGDGLILAPQEYFSNEMSGDIPMLFSDRVFITNILVDPEDSIIADSDSLVSELQDGLFDLDVFIFDHFNGEGAVSSPLLGIISSINTDLNRLDELMGSVLTPIYFFLYIILYHFSSEKKKRDRQEFNFLMRNGATKGALVVSFSLDYLLYMGIGASISYLIFTLYTMLSGTTLTLLLNLVGMSSLRVLLVLTAIVGIQIFTFLRDTRDHDMVVPKDSVKMFALYSAILLFLLVSLLGSLSISTDSILSGQESFNILDVLRLSSLLVAILGYLSLFLLSVLFYAWVSELLKSIGRIKQRLSKMTLRRISFSRGSLSNYSVFLFLGMLILGTPLMMYESIDSYQQTISDFNTIGDYSISIKNITDPSSIVSLDSVFNNYVHSRIIFYGFGVSLLRIPGSSTTLSLGMVGLDIGGMRALGAFDMSPEFDQIRGLNSERNETVVSWQLAEVGIHEDISFVISTEYLANNSMREKSLYTSRGSVDFAIPGLGTSQFESINSGFLLFNGEYFLKNTDLFQSFSLFGRVNYYIQGDRSDAESLVRSINELFPALVISVQGRGSMEKNLHYSLVADPRLSFDLPFYKMVSSILINLSYLMVAVFLVFTYLYVLYYFSTHENAMTFLRYNGWSEVRVRALHLKDILLITNISLIMSGLFGFLVINSITTDRLSFNRRLLLYSNPVVATIFNQALAFLGLVVATNLVGILASLSPRISMEVPR